MGKRRTVRKAAEREHDALAPVRQHAGSPAVRALTPLAKAADEPPLLALGVGTLVLGVVLRRPALARSGLRMAASHLLATGLKTLAKASVDRVRPNVAGARPTLGRGHGTGNTDRNAFPSGHSAGAVAVAEAIRHEAPAAIGPARWAAGLAGALQVARGAHYASDVVAGAAIGWVSERLASWGLAAAGRAVARRRGFRVVAAGTAPAR